VEIGAQRAFRYGKVALRPGREPATAERIADPALLGHTERRARLEGELAAERVGALVGRLPRDDFDLLVAAAREWVECRGAAVATDARGGHAVDVEARVGGRLAADADIVDQLVF